MSAAINSLNMLKDPTVTMDVLNSTFAQNKRLDLLNYERIAQLMPHIQDMIESKYETHNKAGLKSALNVLMGFQNQIVNLKMSNVHGGVDLAREDRIAKCDAVIECFFQLSKSHSFLKSTKRGGEISEIAKKLNSYLTDFLNKTKAELG